MHRNVHANGERVVRPQPPMRFALRRVAIIRIAGLVWISEQIKGYTTPFLRSCPTIVSTTLTGSNREIIADALRSVVDWVDWCLVIDTGISDDTLEIARAVVGDKLVVRQFR